MSSQMGARLGAPEVPATEQFHAAFARIDEYVRQQLDSGEQWGPGLAIAVTDRERLLFAAAYGYANLESKTAVTPATRFEVGSIGKSFVALALLQQHEQGRLDLHAPITDYLPWFSIESEYAAITVHDVLSHSAGLPMGMMLTASSPLYEVAALREQHTGFAAGEHFWYSNVGYMLLGLVLERVSGLPYAEALQRGILDRLGMKESEPIITHDTRTRIAVPYLPLYDDRPWHRSQPLLPTHWLEYTAGDGSVACTVADLATYLRMWLNRGKGVVSEASFALMTAPLMTTEYEGEFYGYGINTRQDEKLGGHTIVFHGGEMVGYHASCTGDMDDGVGVTVFNNGPSDTGSVARFALQVMHAAMQGEALPELPAASDPTKIDNAADYVATYRGSNSTLEVAADGEALYIVREGERITLHHREGDAFYTPHADFALYNIVFSRNEAGKVAELFHGPNWYVSDAYDGPTEFDVAEEWDSYVGHYRSHNPWMQDFRVFMRKGVLQTISFGTWRRPLAALPDGSFRLGEEEYTPERVGFDTILEGKAARAVVSGAEYYRVDTPLAALTAAADAVIITPITPHRR